LKANDHADRNKGAVNITMTADRQYWKPLAPVFNEAVTAFNQWSDKNFQSRDNRNRVTAPLYQYTDAAGLEGIVKDQQMWFTSYTHLNDPSEIAYGMNIASELLSEIGQASDPRVGLFCNMVNDLFTHENLRGAFGFFIASFSRERDDLGQWRAYGDNGRGFALGLAPHLFAITDKHDRKPHENIFVAPVVYGREAARQHHMPAIEQALRIVGSAIESAADIMDDRNVGMPFFDEMGKALIASQLIFNSLTIKHEAYKHEQEVRLIIVGEHKYLMPYIATRSRRGDIVPFIKSDMTIHEKGSIDEIVVGPAAAPCAEDGVCALLRPFNNAADSIVRRSTIPYRPS
jgi:hypothetical protein